MRVFLREGERLKRRARASFIVDVSNAVGAAMGEDTAKEAVERLLED